MALFDLKKMARNMQKSADDLAKTVSDAAENLSDSVKNINGGNSDKNVSHVGKPALENLISQGGAAIVDQLDKAQRSADGLIKTVSSAAGNLPESVKGINAGDSVRNASRKGQSAFEALVSMGGAAIVDDLDREAKTREAVKAVLEKKAETTGERCLSIKDSLKLIYCVMAVDGSISPEEEDKFQEIGTSLDPDFESWQGELMEDLSMKEAVLSDDEEYFDFIHDYAADIMYSAEDTEEGLGAKTLIWDLLVMAFSEGDYSATEKRLVRFVTKALKIDPALPFEMEQALRTVTALNEEEEWLKSLDRPYAVIEERVDEVRERRNTIISGVHALIAD